MTTKHICRAVRIGVFVEAAATVGAVYGGLWLAGWLGEHMPSWTIFPEFALLFAIGFWIVFHDCPLFAKKRTIRGYRCTI